jgi:ParB family chromosome partitioning protein
MSSRAALKARVQGSVYEHGEILDQLDSAAKASEKLRFAPIERVHPNPNQPRKVFDEEKLEELAASLRETGLIQPLAVREVGDGSFEIIAGERRWRAAQRANLPEVPIYIRRTGTLTAADEDSDALDALTENLQRVNLTIMEDAGAVARAVERLGSQQAVAKKLGKTVQWVSKRCCLAAAVDFVASFIESSGCKDHEGLYELTRLADRQPDLARAVIANYRADISLRRQMQAARDGLDIDQVGRAEEGESGEEKPTDRKGKGRAGDRNRVVLVDVVEAATGGLKLRVPSGTFELRFTKAALASLRKVSPKLRPWVAPAVKAKATK